MPISYDDILNLYPPRGKVSEGEVEIVRDMPGLPPASVDEVVLRKDRVLTVVTDNVMFPNYTPGVFTRVFQSDPRVPRIGAIILPIRPSPDGSFDVAWVKQWRHAQMAWMTELPRGGIEYGEDMVTGALRELREETGLRRPELLLHMADMADNSGLTTSICAYYAAVYLGPARLIQREKDETEAIERVIWSPYAEWPKIVAAPPRPGRPVGPLDQFSAAAFGVAFMSGIFERMRKAWSRMYSREFIADPRLSDRLRIDAKNDANDYTLAITFASPDVMERILKPMHLVAGQYEPGAKTAVVKGVTMLALSYLTVYGPEYITGIDLA